MKFSDILADKLNKNLAKNRKVSESRRTFRRFNSINESEMNNETKGALMILRNDKELYKFARGIAEDEDFDVDQVSEILKDELGDELNEFVDSLETEGIELLVKQIAGDAIKRINWVVIAEDFCEK